MAKKAKYDFNRTFQRRLLAIIVQDPKFLSRYCDALDESYFTERTHQIIAGIILHYFQRYKKRPTKTAFLDLINRWLDKKAQMSAEDADEIISEAKRLCRIPVGEDLEYITDKTVHFAQLQSMKMALIESTESLEQAVHDPEHLSQIIPRLQKACAVGSGRDAGIQFFDHLKDPRKFMKSDPAFDRARKVPTGFRSLDRALNGGLGAGELATAGGEPGVGKSLFLTNITAAALRAEKKVVYITLELSPFDVYMRVLQRLTGLKADQLEDHDLYSERLKKFLSRMETEGYFRIREMMPGITTCQHIRSYLSYLQAEDEVTPDLVVIDYADEMKDEESRRTASNDSDYAAYGNIYTGLIRIAKDFRVPIWTASQVNRGGYNQEVVDMAFFADSLKKVMKADVVIGLCREFLKEGRKLVPVPGKLNLFAAKVRRGKSRFNVPCITREERGIIKQCPKQQTKYNLEGEEKRTLQEVGVGSGKDDDSKILYLREQKRKKEAVEV